MRLRFLVHSSAGVADRQPDMRARTGSGILPNVGLIQLDVIGRNGQFRALWHRVSGVDGQIHEHLLDLAGVSGDASQ